MGDQKKYLPDWEQARVHGKASRVGFYDELDHKMCPCCQQKIQKQLIPIGENTKSLQFLGFGFPLFYMFIRNCIILLILLIISNNFISLYISVKDGNEYCNSHLALSVVPKTHSSHFIGSRQFNHQEEESAEDPKLYLTCKCRNFMLLMARTDKQQKDYEVIFRVCSFVIHVLCLLYIKDKITKTWQYYDEMESDLSDYAVLVKRLPPGITGVKGRLTDLIAAQPTNNGKPFNIHEIILIPQSEKVHQLHEEQEQAIEHFLNAKQKGDPNIQHYLKKLQKISEQKHHLVQETIHLINNDKVESQNAIIIFETEPEKQNFLDIADQILEKEKMDRYFDNPIQSLVIIEAPEPREILYENLPYEHDKTKNLCIGWGLSLLFLVVITVVFYFIQLVKTNNLVSAIEQQEEDPEGASSQKLFANIIAWVTLLSIVFFNKFVMGRVLHSFTHLEKHDNKAHQDFSFAFKYALGMFFTTAIMTILVEALKYHNYYKHDFGVIQEETIMFFLCAFMVPAIWFINPFQLCHLYQRWRHYGKNDVSQHQANHLMADYHYDMGKRYAQIIQMMWFTFLYADLIPIGAFLILIGFGIYYWVDKVNLLRGSSLQGNISGDLAKKALSLLDLTLFWRFLGELIFDIQIRDRATTQTMLFLGLSVLYMLIPWDSVLEIVNSESFKLNDKSFTSEKVRFQYDNYKSYHPIYSKLSNRLALGEQEFLANDLFHFASTLNGGKEGPNNLNFFLPVKNVHAPENQSPYHQFTLQNNNKPNSKVPSNE